MLKYIKSVESKASFLRSKDEAEEGVKTRQVEKKRKRRRGEGETEEKGTKMNKKK